jgi:hypothetical protein
MAGFTFLNLKEVTLLALRQPPLWACWDRPASWRGREGLPVNGEK